jgi:hypothetical protein
MSIEALWTVEFVSVINGQPSSIGAGVIIFETERIFGGDNQFYYIGRYKVDNENIEGQAEVINYSGESHSIFGELNRFKLNIKGKVTIPTMKLSGYMIDDPSKQIFIVCQKKEQLP